MKSIRELKAWGIFSFIIWAHFVLLLLPFPWTQYESIQIQARDAVAAQESLQLPQNERLSYEEWRVGITKGTWGTWVVSLLYSGIGFLSSLLLFYRRSWWPYFLGFISLVAVIDISLDMFDLLHLKVVGGLLPNWVLNVDIERIYLHIHIGYLWRIGFIILFSLSVLELLKRRRSIE